MTIKTTTKSFVLVACLLASVTQSARAATSAVTSAVTSTVTSMTSNLVLPRIVGGQEVAGGEFPSTVALVRNGSNSLFDRQFCAANVIGAQWVLTAAHCLFDPNGNIIDASSILAAVGVTDLDNNPSATEIVITNLFIHPQYDPAEVNAYHDIAVLELAQPTSQALMPLFSGDVDAQVGSMATVVGWGSLVFNENGSYVFPTNLNQVSIPLASRAVCNQPDSYNGILSPGQICAGFDTGGKDSCVGDSGGPLMLVENGNHTQVGIVSFGIGCALPGKYGIYTSVSYYRSWIIDVLGGQVDPGTYQTSAGKDRLLIGGSSGSASWQLLLCMLALVFFRRFYPLVTLKTA